eukprot:scaffold377284_cov37-Prasinocladus_malaysianus.AAC.1
MQVATGRNLLASNNGKFAPLRPQPIVSFRSSAGRVIVCRVGAHETKNGAQAPLRPSDLLEAGMSASSASPSRPSDALDEGSAVSSNGCAIIKYTGLAIHLYETK